LRFYYESKRPTKVKGRWHILMNWQEGEWCWLNNEHLDEVDEDLIVFASSSGVAGGGEAETRETASCDCPSQQSAIWCRPRELEARNSGKKVGGMEIDRLILK
jgi:hypothetical protein